MPLYPYPDVPEYLGVPSIRRNAFGLPTIQFQVISPWDTQALPIPTSVEPPWGIYLAGTQEAFWTPFGGGTLSTFSFGLAREMAVSDFPIEANTSGNGAAFASFNKVWRPANPTVTLSFSGSDAENSALLAAIDNACQTVSPLYDVYTPDAIYKGYTMERYSYQRSATHGASMLTVEISLKEILQVAAAYSNVQPIAPQSPSATKPTNNGITQPAPVPSSILYDIKKGILGLF